MTSTGDTPTDLHRGGNRTESQTLDGERERAQRREQAVLRLFVDVTAGLVGDVDVHEALTRLAEHLIDIVDADACGIMVIDDRHRLGVAAAVPRTARDLESFQLEVDDGPCLESARTGRPVHSGDLTVDTRRWPAGQRTPSTLGSTPCRPPRCATATSSSAPSTCSGGPAA